MAYFDIQTKHYRRTTDDDPTRTTRPVLGLPVLNEKGAAEFTRVQALEFIARTVSKYGPLIHGELKMGLRQERANALLIHEA